MRSSDVRTIPALVSDRSAYGIVIGWRSLVPGVLILTALLVAAWHAGRQSEQLEGQLLSTQVNDLTQKIASDQLELEQQYTKNSELEAALKSSGKSGNLAVIPQLRSQLLKAQAEANQYKTILNREQQDSTDNKELVEALSAPGTRLVALRGAESAVDTTAYALLSNKGQLVLVASKLPKLPEDRQFQLWIVRKQDSKAVSAGVFSADDDKRALMNVTDLEVPVESAQLIITDEPEGGSSEPTGSKLLETHVPEKAD